MRLIKYLILLVIVFWSGSAIAENLYLSHGADGTDPNCSTINGGVLDTAARIAECAAVCLNEAGFNNAANWGGAGNDSIDAGDTVYIIDDGGNITPLTFKGSGGAGSVITLAAYTGERPTITGAILTAAGADYWVQVAGKNEWYYTTALGGNPGLNEVKVSWLSSSSALKTRGTVGSLTSGQWGWGDGGGGWNTYVVYSTTEPTTERWYIGQNDAVINLYDGATGHDYITLNLTGITIEGGQMSNEAANQSAGGGIYGSNASASTNITITNPTIARCNGYGIHVQEGGSDWNITNPDITEISANAGAATHGDGICIRNMETVNIDGGTIYGFIDRDMIAIIDGLDINIDGVTFLNADSRNQYIIDMSPNAGDVLEDVYIENCIFGSASSPIALNRMVTGDKGSATSFDKVYIRTCTMYVSPTSASGRGVSLVGSGGTTVITKNKIIGAKQHCIYYQSALASDKATISYNYLQANTDRDGNAIYLDAGPGLAFVRYNIGYLMDKFVYSRMHTFIHNNLSYNADNYVIAPGAGARTHLWNNILYNTGTNYFIYDSQNPATFGQGSGGKYIGFNLYYPDPSPAANRWRFNTTYYTSVNALNAYETTALCDKTENAVDPQLISPGTDFRLYGYSPAVGAGGKSPGITELNTGNAASDFATEANAIAGWTAVAAGDFGGTAFESQGVTKLVGSYALHGVANAAGQGRYWKGTIASGEIYTISLIIRLANGDTESALIKVGTSEGDTTYASETYAIDDTWTLKTYSFLSSSVNLYVTITAGDTDNDNAEVFIDNMSVRGLNAGALNPAVTVDNFGAAGVITNSDQTGLLCGNWNVGPYALPSHDICANNCEYWSSVINPNAVLWVNSGLTGISLQQITNAGGLYLGSDPAKMYNIAVPGKCRIAAGVDIGGAGDVQNIFFSESEAAIEGKSTGTLNAGNMAGEQFSFTNWGFVDQANGDYRIRRDSAMRSAGTSDSEADVDFLGRPIPDRSGFYPVGAYTMITSFRGGGLGTFDWGFEHK